MIFLPDHGDFMSFMSDFPIVRGIIGLLGENPSRSGMSLRQPLLITGKFLMHKSAPIR